MTTDEIIKTLELAKAEVEWNYPLDYCIAIDEAIEIIHKYEESCNHSAVCPVCERIIGRRFPTDIERLKKWSKKE